MIDRAAEMTAIADQVLICQKCDLSKTRTKAVPGYGDINAEILFIGEGPGFHEDKQGLPFVGRSGEYLDKLLALLGLNRSQVFITNVVKCRPPENRDPMPDEILACKPYLEKQQSLIDPLIIVTLGRFSMARYFPGDKITQIHGKPKFDDRVAYYPLFHPAAVLRNPSLQETMAQDFKRIPQVIEEVKKRREAAGNGGRAPNQSAAGEPPKTDDKPTQLSMF